MRINLLKINGFGKLKDKELILNEKINIIYGKNEQGKTTLLKFLNSMLYGISKNKNGKEISDFERYKPWNNGEFSGKISYTLDNNENFEIYREFSKKNPKIFNSVGDDISKEFNNDKNKGIQAFYEQTGIDENIFNASNLIEQKEIILNQEERRNIIQKISNLFSTGDENISYKKTVDKLNKKYIDEVGTDRTSDRPLNIMENKINEIKLKIKNIELNKEHKKNIENKIEKLNIEIKNNENKIILFNEIKKIKEKIKNKYEEIKIKNNLMDENKNKINILEKNNKKNKKENKIINKKILLIIFIILILEIINLIIKINLKLKIIISIILILFLLIFYLFNLINKNKIKNIENNKINNEKNIIKKIINDLEEDINKLNNEINNEEKNEKNNLIKKYNSIFSEYEIINNFNFEIEKIENNIKNLEEKNNNLKFEKYQIEIEEKNINKNIEEKLNLEEKLENLQEEENEIINNGKAIKLAKEILEKAYNKMKNNITPKFQENILKNKTGIMGNKYENIIFDEDGLRVELDNGNYVSANLLSIGTIDQLYLSLRLATMEEISTENMPIILDEAFAYYDDERLESILKFLNENFKNNQIIIFTCSKREKEILNNLKINYNLIEL